MTCKYYLFCSFLDTFKDNERCVHFTILRNKLNKQTRKSDKNFVSSKEVKLFFCQLKGAGTDLENIDLFSKNIRKPARKIKLLLF